MNRRAEQAEWAVILLMRENPPGHLSFEDERRLDPELLDVGVAIGAFSRAISRGEPDERRVAAEALAWVSDRRAISPLIRGLRDPMWDVRHAAAAGLASFRPLPNWALPALGQAIADPEPAVRAEAASALGRIRAHESIPPLVSAIDDRFRSVRLAAVWALEDLGRAAISSLSAVTRLAHLLEQEEDPYVAYGAYWALGWQGGSATNAQRAAFRASDRGRTVWNAVAGD